MGKYWLVHTHGNLIHGGTKAECEMILASFIRYGINEHKFDIELRMSDGKRFEMYDSDHVPCVKDLEYVVCSCNKCNPKRK